MKKTALTRTILFIICLLNAQLLSAQTSGTKAFDVTITGKGTPMLFIPGAACSGEVWKETIARYSKNHECHVFTLAGYAGVKALGQSPYLDTYKTELIQYIKNKKLENVILVGHSIGGFLSLSVASEMKDHLKKVIIADGLPFYAGVMNPDAKSGFREEQAKAMLTAYNKMDAQSLKANQMKITRSMCADSTKWDIITEWGTKSDPFLQNELVCHRYTLRFLTFPSLKLNCRSSLCQAYCLIFQQHLSLHLTIVI